MTKAEGVLVMAVLTSTSPLSWATPSAFRSEPHHTTDDIPYSETCPASGVSLIVPSPSFEARRTVTAPSHVLPSNLEVATTTKESWISMASNYRNMYTTEGGGLYASL